MQEAESEIDKIINEGKKGKDAGISAKSILALSAEHVRLELIRKLGEGPATLQRPTSGQNEVESLFVGLNALGVNMPATLAYIRSNRELSPGAAGKGIDSYLKVLTPVPTFAMPGSAVEEKKEPNILARFLAFMAGTKQKGGEE